MNAKAALIKELLAGKVINIKTCFMTTGLTNAPRELSRMIEKPFDVTISRTPRQGKSKYGQKVSWFDYRLNRSEHNLSGIQKMISYLQEQEGNKPPQTDKQEKEAITTQQITKLHQQTLFQ